MSAIIPDYQTREEIPITERPVEQKARIVVDRKIADIADRNFMMANMFLLAAVTNLDKVEVWLPCCMISAVLAANIAYLAHQA